MSEQIFFLNLRAAESPTPPTRLGFFTHVQKSRSPLHHSRAHQSWGRVHLLSRNPRLERRSIFTLIRWVGDGEGMLKDVGTHARGDQTPLLYHTWHQARGDRGGRRVLRLTRGVCGLLRRVLGGMLTSAPQGEPDIPPP